MRRLLIATAALLSATSAHAATVVTFDNSEGNAALYSYLGTTSVQGLTFSYPGYFAPGVAAVWDGSSPNSNGTNNLIIGFTPGTPVTITKTGGGLFDLSSLDLAISWYSGASNANVLINGNPLAITNSLATYTLGLTNVSSVTITGLDTADGYLSADNLVYSNSAVPEPSTWAMMLVGFGMVGYGLRSRRKPSVRVAYA